MSSKSAPPFRTNPSAIARYFFHDCERFLFYRSATPEHRKRLGLPEPAFDGSPLVEAVLQSGHRWEREVIEKLLRGRVVVAPGSGELHTRRLTMAETLRRLRTEPTGRYLYQPTLSPPRGFYDVYGIDPKVVAISDNHPDLIEILPGEGGGRLLRVIDLKRGESLKLTHRVQILFYALELQALLDESSIPNARVDLGRGAVWLGQQPEPEVFDLGAFRPHLERFLRHGLTRVLAGKPGDAHWHLYERCEWCEFFDHCRDEMRRTDDVSRLVQLTPYGKRHLRDEAHVRTVGELGTFLRRADADEVLDRCASLAGQRHRLAVRVAALSSAEPQLHGGFSPDLPRGENVALFLTLQREPLGQSVYLAGVLVNAREEIRQDLLSPAVAKRLTDEAGKNRPAVWLAERPADVPSVRRGLITLLDDLFQRLQRYNAARPEWKDQLTLQAYVHTEEERALLFATLLEALKEPDLAERAMTLLFHFQGPELLHADRHPTSEVAYPIVVLLNAVSRLLALPVEVSYTLPEMLAALGSSFAYRRRDYYHFPLGHGLRAEALHAAWYQGKVENLDEIRRQASLYLFAQAALLRGVRERAAAHLFAWPPRFALPSGAGIRHPLLSRLAFFARYESLLGCLAIREVRAEARATQVLLGQVIELEALDAETMRVVGPLPVPPEATGFPAWLLVRDDEDGRRAQVEYADYWYRNKFHGGSAHAHRAIVGIRDVRSVADDMQLKLSYGQAFKGSSPRRGERFLLYQRFTDFTTDRVVKFLEEEDQIRGEPDADEGLFLRLLRRPEDAASALPLSTKVGTAAERGADGFGFTPSQRTAFDRICRQRVTAVWGPPGTGKTHFLATTIVGLAAAHAAAGKPFRVLVTAFTHAAIENLLRKLGDRVRELRPARLDLRLAKAKYWQSAIADVPVFEEDALGDWLADHDHAVLGATVYTCLKKRAELPEFDLVVIDEASQVRVPEAAVAAAFVADNGRLVLAGDHFQLPPIVAGTYPEPPADEPALHRSIFEAVGARPLASGGRQPPGAPQQGADAPRSPGIMCQLLENFRMNDVLTGYAARLLYGPGYRCVDESVARRRLNFKGKRGLDPLIKACLDPAYPLVVLVLDGIRSSRANPVEADLVAELVTALRDGLRDASGRPYDDAAFFRSGVFVVSPHHAQITAIKKELAKRRAWTVAPFVDTVDKMQGQEADAVVVSYGVSDPEFALHEAEFIYGMNRLNVALTRGRCKSIVCLPRPLLEASPQVLDVEPAAAGLAFMRLLVETLEREGEEETFEGEEVEARVLRARCPPNLAGCGLAGVPR